MIRWTEANSVKNATLDEQHKRVFEIVAELSQALAEGRGDAVIHSTLPEVNRIAKRHFATEEELMAEHDYPGLPTHRAEHDFFREQLSGLVKACKKEKCGVPVSLMLLLQKWVNQHMKLADKSYSDFVDSYVVR